MIIKKIGAKAVKNSRGKKTICVIVKTSCGRFRTSAPSGKSKGKYEVKSYARGGLNSDIKFFRKLDVEKINGLGIEKFEDLKKVERLVNEKIGGNSLFAFEASLLKALARENGKELWEFLGGRKRLFSKKDAGKKFRMRSVGNVIGGGLHSEGVSENRPDFQEFLFIARGKSFAECVKINRNAYKMARKLLKAYQRNDEGAWETGLENETVLDIMSEVRKKLRVDIGLDVAGSSFYKNGFYNYKNPSTKLNKNEQINYIKELIKDYKIFYVEDGLEENDFAGFRGLGKSCLIVGDDLTTTNPSRLKKAIRVRAINGIIVKPNQIGSLLKVKEVVDISRRAGIKTIMSHRSGETKDNTIADLAVGFGCDFIKTGIYGRVREAKLKRVIEIEEG